MAFKVPEQYRLNHGKFATIAADGNNGVFHFSLGGPEFLAIAADGAGWEHVSISTNRRCPTWEEMQMIKLLFWGEEDCVVQYHPPQSEYVNNHPYCLHLWRPIDVELPRPPSLLVGLK